MRGEEESSTPESLDVMVGKGARITAWCSKESPFL